MNDDLDKKFEDFDHFLSTISKHDIESYKKVLYKKVDEIAEVIEKASNKEELKERFFQICDKFATGRLHRRARNKPLGYAGDFLMIDWIYTEKSVSNGLGKYFDELFLNYEAAQAVKNRKQYFVNKCVELSHQKNGRIDILDIACGPCRDVLETFQKTDNGTNLHFHCIDSEPKAIEYARRLLAHTEAQNNIRLDNTNVFKLRTSEKYNLIWIAGLFDYLDDRIVKILLKKLWRYLKDGGQIIFGNFSPDNPTRKGMELVARWNLIHRSADELIKLCTDAGLPFSEIEVEHEPLGVNLFCVIKK